MMTTAGFLLDKNDAAFATITAFLPSHDTNLLLVLTRRRHGQGLIFHHYFGHRRNGLS